MEGSLHPGRPRHLGSWIRAAALAVNDTTVPAEHYVPGGVTAWLAIALVFVLVLVLTASYVGALSLWLRARWAESDFTVHASMLGSS